jgi:hypothetical protein
MRSNNSVAATKSSTSVIGGRNDISDRSSWGMKWEAEKRLSHVPSHNPNTFTCIYRTMKNKPHELTTDTAQHHDGPHPTYYSP